MTIFDDIYDPGFDYLGYVFGETVTLYQEGQRPRQINAIIDRDSVVVGQSGIPTRVFSVTVKRDNVRGVDPTALDVSCDYLTLEKVRGEEPSQVTILEVGDSSSGVVVLSCN